MTARRWIVLAEVGLALVVIGASAVVGVTLAIALIAALGLFGLVLFVPMKDGRKTMARTRWSCSPARETGNNPLQRGPSVSRRS